MMATASDGPQAAEPGGCSPVRGALVPERWSFWGRMNTLGTTQRPLKAADTCPPSGTLRWTLAPLGALEVLGEVRPALHLLQVGFDQREPGHSDHRTGAAHQR